MPTDPRADARSGDTKPPALPRLALAGVAILVLLVLAACSNSGPTTVTVHGLVTDQLRTPLGVAFPGITATAAVGAADVPVASDGTFTIDGVTPPYDLTIAVPSLNIVLVYLGLTRSDPTLSLIEVGPTQHSADVSGSIGVTLASGEVGALVPGSDRYVLGGTLLSAGDGPSFGPLTLGWGGGATRAATLYALTATASGGPPTAFTGFGSTSLSLTDGATVTGADITLDSVTTSSMDGNITAPAGYTVQDAGAVLRLGSPTGALVGIGSGSMSGGSFTGLNVPVHSGIAYGIVGAAQGSAGGMTEAWSNAAGPGTTATLTLPAPAVQTAPASGATGIGPGTPFRFTALPSAVYVAVLAGPSASDPDVYVVTDQTSFDLPDLSNVGMPLTAGASYTYNVAALGPFASIDDFTDAARGLTGEVQLETLLTSGSGTLPYAGGPTDAGGQPVFLTNSASTDFTTAP